MDGSEAARIMYGEGGMSELNILAKLREEFPQGQVTFRPGKITSDGAKGLPLAYIDARDVMERLDSIMGCDWKDEYYFNGVRTMCRILLKINNEWIGREDGAGDTNIEGEKGGLSDAFKRAAVKWGVGRYLYDLSFMYAPVDKYKKFIDDDFDLWKYQIKKGMKPVAKIEPTPERKQEAAKKMADTIITEYKACKDLNALSDVQTKYHNELKAFSERYIDIFNEINTVGLQIIASFDNKGAK